MTIETALLAFLYICLGFTASLIVNIQKDLRDRGYTLKDQVRRTVALQHQLVIEAEQRSKLNLRISQLETKMQRLSPQTSNRRPTTNTGS